MIRRFTLPFFLSLAAAAPGLCAAQAGVAGASQTPVPDSIAVVGQRRNNPTSIVQISGLQPGHPINYRDVQRAILALYTSGQFDDVQMTQAQVGGKNVLVIHVHERPILARWAVRGVQRLSEHSVRDKVALAEGRPLDPAAVERGRARIDSQYHAQGYYLAQTKALFVYERDSSAVRVIFDITEGNRVAIAQVDFQGNTHFTDAQLAAQMSTSPEGFWWFHSGEYNDDKIGDDLHQKLPSFYGKQGYVDFQVLDDTLVMHEPTGKATLVVKVSEGEPYRIGTFEIVGNRRFSTEELETFYPFTGEQRSGILGLGGKHRTIYFDDQQWQDATRKLQTLYYNNGYIYVNVRPDEIGRAHV